MIKPDTILDEIHTIRRKIDKQTKGMTYAEIIGYLEMRPLKNMVLRLLAARQSLNFLLNFNNGQVKLRY